MTAAPIIDMRDYAPAARRFWWACVVAGFAILGWAIGRAASLEAAAQMQILALAAVAAVVGLFPVRIPGTKMSVAGGEIFIFLALVLHGPAAAILVCAVEGAIASWRTSRRWTSRIGTPAMVAIAMFACGLVFEAGRSAIAAAGYGTPALITALMAFGMLYFAGNTGLTSTLLALKRGERLRPWRWWNEMGWIGLAYMASGTIAGLLFASFERFGLPALAAAAPMIALFLCALHLHFEKRDAEERHVAELAASESRFHGAFTHAAIGMALTDTEGTFTQVNDALCAILHRNAQELIGTNVRALLHEGDVAALQSMLGGLLARRLERIETEIRVVRGDGAEAWIALNVALARDWDIRSMNLIVQAQDITARHRAEAELYQHAYFDSLTGLPNRKRFAEHLGQAIARWQRRRERNFAVMYLDFDRFKVVNDSLGHRAGDQLLGEIARRLVSVLRPTDLVARLGGDEFAVLIEDLEHDRQALELADRIQRCLGETVMLGGIEVSVTASIGITFSSNGYSNAEEVVRDADIAMYQAKMRGKAQYALFDSSLHRIVSGQLKLESQLRHALGEGELFLVYQPIHALDGNRLVGFEALVRWHHPEHGVLEPGAFIPTAEETGIIEPLGRWVMREACRQLRAWEDEHGASNMRMSVNVSSLELRLPDFVANVRQCLDETGIEPSQLLVEVTESVMMDGVSNAVPALRALRQMGVAIGIDDFGTGFSSLGYLATLPIDVLKVDKCFIESLDRGDGGEIAKAIFKLGQALGKEVLAEGVETDAQLGTLRAIGCPYGQGYLFARPLGVREAGDLMRSANWAPASAGATVNSVR